MLCRAPLRSLLLKMENYLLENRSRIQEQILQSPQARTEHTEGAVESEPSPPEHTAGVGEYIIIDALTADENINEPEHNLDRELHDSRPLTPGNCR